MMPYHARPVLERFLEKVNKNGPEPTMETMAYGKGRCHLWTGTVASRGYGVLRVGSRSDKTRDSKLAHRLSVEFFISEIPEGMEVDHMCRNRICVNPDHLRIVTPRVNLLENVVGSAIFIQRAKTTCPKGHPYDYLEKKKCGGFTRRCKKCRSEKDKAYKIRKKERSLSV